MNFVPIPTKIFQKGEDLFAFFEANFPEISQKFLKNSVVIISSKLVALSQNRISSKEMKTLIEQESEKIFSQTGEFFLTKSQGIIIPNAGIDQSNAEAGTKILWPSNPQNFADTFREKIQKKWGIKNIGVVISDSRITPARRGTTGVALAWSGIEGVYDERGHEDIFGKKLEVSTINIADNVVSGAEILMGQSDAKTPFVLVENFPEKYFTDAEQSPTMAIIPQDEDLFHL